MAQKHSSTIQVFTFGIGSGCDKRMVVNVAREGRGTSTIVDDNSSGALKGLVIKALSKSMTQSLSNMSYGFEGKLKTSQNIFQDTLIH